MREATTLGTVEKERESYTLKTISGALFGQPDTSNLVKNKIIYKRVKGNAIMTCGYYDTG